MPGRRRKSETLETATAPAAGAPAGKSKRAKGTQHSDSDALNLSLSPVSVSVKRGGKRTALELAPTSNVGKCKHVGSVSVERVTKAFVPLHWVCSVCTSPENVLVCLTCGVLACGREVRGHAKEHFEKHKHPLALDLNTSSCWCYICQD